MALNDNFAPSHRVAVFSPAHIATFCNDWFPDVAVRGTFREYPFPARMLRAAQLMGAN